MTLISRLLGFVRDVILASVFGAGPAFDAFVVAFKIPNFMRRLFGEGAFAQAFIPILSEYHSNRTTEEICEFINRIAGGLSTTLLLFVTFVEITAPVIIMIFTPGFIGDPVRLIYATHMLRITAPYSLLIALTAFASAILNTFSRFAVPALIPVLLNIVMIVLAWFWAPCALTPIYVLAWGVLIGGILQLVIQFPFMYRLGVLPIPQWKWNDPGVLRVLKLMIPALFGVSVTQISLLIDNLFASFLPVGSISWLYYSDRLTYLPLGVIGVALATVVLPDLSRQYSTKSPEAYTAILDWALRIAILIGVPSAVALFILAGPLLATLIYHGAFTAHDFIMTRKSLWAFSVGLPGFILIKILVSAFYARQDVKTPVKIAILTVGINLILNALLIHSLAHAGLALATSLASSFNAILLLYFLLRRSIYVPVSNWRKFIFQLIVANVAMASIIAWFSGEMNCWLAWSINKRVWHLAMIILSGFITYLVTLSISGLNIYDLRPPVNID
nr:murein biosynthesis integral membrane protein MurJ [Coxiella endosymbiont of Amblyomma nuttalli]